MRFNKDDLKKGLRIGKNFVIRAYASSNPLD